MFETDIDQSQYRLLGESVPDVWDRLQETIRLAQLATTVQAERVQGGRGGQTVDVGQSSAEAQSEPVQGGRAGQTVDVGQSSETGQVERVQGGRGG
jgi:hypothetical protein